MNAMSLMATLGIDTSDYESGLKGASGTAQNFASTFKKILGGIAIGTAVTKVGQAVVSLTKSAVAAYADYQQLEGGVQTLFGNGGKSFEQYAESASDSLYKMGQRGEDVLKIQKAMVAAGYDIGATGADGIYGPKTKAAFEAYAKAGGALVREAYNNTEKASDLVIENAKKAYMTAGLDANTYMETVTGFSASLLQSLGGDTMKAAELSDQAMIDMADNSNKMGTDIGAIMVAYQGFAKQNYTMLDNLKLGYGGTKTEMERLIKDANKLRVAQGLAGDLTIEKYSDVIEAIHLVQTEMGITGTTALEAQTTITGSLNATKAAWKNLLISFATGNKRDIKQAMDGMVASARNVVTNVVPVVSTALTSISGFIGEIAPVVVQELPGIISEVGPAFLNAVGSMISAVVTNAPAIINSLWTVFDTTISEIQGWLEEQFPGLGAVFENLNTIVTNVSDGIKTAWESVKGTVTSISETLGVDLIEILTEVTGFLAGNEESVGKYSAALEALAPVVTGLIFAFAAFKATLAIEGVITAATTAVSGFFAVLSANPIALVIAAVAFLVGAFTTAYNKIEWFREAVDTAWAAIKEGASAAWEAIQEVWNGAGDFFSGIFATIAENPVLAGIAAAITAPFQAAFAVVDLMWSAFTAIFTGQWDAVAEKASGMLDKIKQPFVDAWDAIKVAWESVGEFFGGIWEGITTNETLTGLVDSMKKPFTDAVDGLKENWESVGEFFSGIWEGITTNETFVGLVDAIKKPFTDAVDGLKENWESIGEFFSGIWDGISTNETLIGLVDVIKKPFEDAKKAIDDVINAIGDGISSMISKVSEWTGIDLTAPFSNVAAAATEAFNAVIGVIQSAIDKVAEFVTSYSKVNPDKPQNRYQQGYEYFNSQGHATAMAHGEILQGLTPFGIDSNGTIHYGGEAGPEAIVGVNSLDSMIQQSVNNAVGAVLSRLDTIIGGQNQGDIQVVLDSGVLVGQMARGMDKKLGKMAAWRGGGRA